MKRIAVVQFHDHVANPGADSEQNRFKSTFRAGPDLQIYLEDGDVHLVGATRRVSVPGSFRKWCEWDETPCPPPASPKRGPGRPPKRV